jgi:hypothetical protein
MVSVAAQVPSSGLVVSIGAGTVLRPASAEIASRADPLGVTTTTAHEASATASSVDATTLPVAPTTLPLPSVTLPPVTLPPVTLPPVTLPGGPALIAGVVVDRTGRPVVGRCVDAMNGTDTYAAVQPDGQYEFTALPPAWPEGAATTLTVVDCATHDYGQTSSLPVWVRTTPAVVNLTLDKMPLLGGAILDSSDRPIPGACAVEVSGPAGATLLTPMPADSSGRFGPDAGVAPGVYQFEVRKDCGMSIGWPSDGRTSLTVTVTPNNIVFVPFTVIPIPS